MRELPTRLTDVASFRQFMQEHELVVVQQHQRLEKLHQRQREMAVRAQQARSLIAASKLTQPAEGTVKFRAVRAQPARVREIWLQTHHETIKALAEAGFTPASAARRAGFPVEVLQRFAGTRVMIESFALGRLLRACGVPEAIVDKMVAMMAVAEDSDDVLGLPVWRPEELDVSDFELRITTCVELANVLRYLVEKSGIPKLRLACQAGISRSQLYNLIDAERHALPRNRDQLYVLLRTCALSEPQTEFVLRQWDQLDRDRAEAVTMRPDVGPELPLTPAFHDDLKDQPSTPTEPPPADEPPAAVEPGCRGRRRFGRRRGLQAAFAWIQVVAIIAAIINSASIFWLLDAFRYDTPGSVIATVSVMLFVLGIATAAVFAHRFARRRTPAPERDLLADWWRA
ncbi:hypothetical protein [Amycolatopsis sp. NPDC004169]|uniref:hypothetical protein n=1 Tax=Amycolatopsis sp. NPDC004169 TaxID=3154453 RepID=UPI0033A8E166